VSRPLRIVYPGVWYHAMNREKTTRVVVERIENCANATSRKTVAHKAMRGSSAPLFDGHNCIESANYPGGIGFDVACVVNEGSLAFGGNSDADFNARHDILPGREDYLNFLKMLEGRNTGKTLQLRQREQTRVSCKKALTHDVRLRKRADRLEQQLRKA
jgi:hypothetical protein